MRALPRAVVGLAVGALIAATGGCAGARGPAEHRAAAVPDYGDPIAIGQAARRRPPQVVEPPAGSVAGVPAPEEPPAAPDAPAHPRAASVDPGPAPDDAEIRRELREGGLTGAARASVTPGGLAIAPVGGPPAVRAMIAAANQIARAPYRYGGGHATWVDTAYDCSGSVSYALAAAGLLAGPLDSTGLAAWGLPGPGRWVTIYANGGHALMTVAGLRFDTSGRGPNGSRWQPALRSTAGFAVRHPPGL